VVRAASSVVLVSFVALSLQAQSIPHTEAETLAGKKIVLPDAFAAHPAILVIGFSRSGGDSAGRWSKQLRQDLAADKNVRIFSVAELQDAPKLARGLIRHGMRGGIPQNEHDSFVLLYQDEDVWKKLADFSDTNDAYVLLVNPNGAIRWRAHGKAPDAQTVSALKKEVAELTSNH
jgi:ATP synthase subunit 10